MKDVYGFTDPGKDVEGPIRSRKEELKKEYEKVNRLVNQNIIVNFQLRERKDYIDFLNKFLVLLDETLLRVRDIPNRASLISKHTFKSAENLDTFNKLANIVGSAKALEILNLMETDSIPEPSEFSVSQNPSEELVITWDAVVVLYDVSQHLRIIPAKFYLKKQMRSSQKEYVFSFELIQTDYEFEDKYRNDMNQHFFNISEDLKNLPSRVERFTLGLPSEVHFSDPSELPKYLKFIKSRFYNLELSKLVE